MGAYTFTVFVSAFLLFQVQPLLAKAFLPWYGGVPAVWTACLLFFQIALLLGYAYASGVARLSARAQTRTHIALVAASLAALALTASAWGVPLLPLDALKPTGQENPAWHLAGLLALAVGAPFVTLSATAPLVQHWYARERVARPYRLYAISNLGSLLGLLAYPFAIEALVPLRAQAYAWSIAYVAFATGIVVLAWRARATRTPAAREDPSTEQFPRPRPTPRQRLLWFAFPACASVLLLAVTDQLSQEMAVVPLLWVLPLTVYLVSFILCFASARWYRREVYTAALVLALVLMTLAAQHGIHASLLAQIVLYTAGLFVACMVLHGELARIKPHARYLTEFYLTLTAGGATGGLFVGVVAPQMFPAYWELALGLWACAALALLVLWRDRSSVLHRGSVNPALLTVFGAGLLAVLTFADQLQSWTAAGGNAPRWTYAALAALAFASASAYALIRPARVSGAGRSVSASRRRPRGRPVRAHLFLAALALFGLVQLENMRAPIEDSVATARNFFGVLHVSAIAPDAQSLWLKLRHGHTVHGWQRVVPASHEPYGYYGPASGVGLALDRHAVRRAGEPLRVGVVGLGTGTLAVYGRDGDHFRFYEINPAVVHLSDAPRGMFTYVRDSRATIDIVVGDARVALERERGNGWQRYDALVLDAFNSGAIPAHLLTTEALALYLARVAPAGVIAIHISNRFLDLRPLMFGLAQAHDLAIAVVEHTEADGETSSLWALLAHRADALPVPVTEPPAGLRTVLWRDDYTNLLPLVHLTLPPARAESSAAIEEAATMLDPAR